MSMIIVGAECTSSNPGSARGTGRVRGAVGGGGGGWVVARVRVGGGGGGWVVARVRVGGGGGGGRDTRPRPSSRITVFAPWMSTWRSAFGTVVKFDSPENSPEDSGAALIETE